jgi:undecaprenyl-diphosphatase
MIVEVIKAIALGILEGLTEFLPVSSTGHLLLLDHFLGFDDEDFGKAFVILIQLGAILALLSIYFMRLWNIALALPRDPGARRFVFGILLAFLPAAVIGAATYEIIKSVLFNVWIVCTMLIAGGFVLLWVDRLELKARYHDVMHFPMRMYLGIGLVQCLAMIPGVSRSGATIIGAMLFGADRRTAAEFSFFLAMPTMTGAFAYALYKNWALMGGSNTILVAVGFAASFIAGWIVVKTFLDYVARQGFALFAWWRIIIGALGLIGLALMQ